MFFRKQYDFVGIGDTTIDDFIRISQAEVICDETKEHCKLCLNFADKIPYDEAIVVPAVGNSANAAVAASRLGLKSALISNIGDDENGIDCVETLDRNKVSSEFIAINKNRKTNYHYVLWHGDDRTILVKHEEYEYKLPDFGKPKWVYLSSLGANSENFHKEIEKYLVERPEIKLAFQPGTFQIKLGMEVLAGILKRTDVFFCNKEEAQRILKSNEEDMKNLLRMIFNLGPKLVVITEGVKGAYTYDGKEILFMKPYPDPKQPVERTGAGDAFSSTFVSALALGMNVRDALKWSPINPMSVVQYVGSQEGLLTREQIEEYLTKAPSDYEPQIIS